MAAKRLTASLTKMAPSKFYPPVSEASREVAIMCAQLCTNKLLLSGLSGAHLIIQI